MTAALKKIASNNPEEYAFDKAQSLYPIAFKEFSAEEEARIADAFPPIDPESVPLGNRVLIQIRAPQEKTAGGILLPGSMDSEQLYQEQVGKVIALGATCFHSQSTMAAWPEGKWFSLGDFVRIPRFGGDKRWPRENAKGQKALFVLFRDYDILEVILGNPLDFKGYV